MPWVISTPLADLAPTPFASNITPHFQAPFHLTTNGKPAINEQGTPADLAAQVYNVMVCAQGAKLGDPQFGIPSPLFQTVPLNTAAILQAVQRLVPGADITVSEVADAFSAAIRDLTVTVALAA